MTPTLLQITGVIAHAGDLSMGQPTGHSPRVALLAAGIAEALGAGAARQRDVAMASLMRWSGCSANASGFAAVLGDDIAGRAELVAGDATRAEQVAAAAASGVLQGLAATHCEVAQQLALGLGLGEAVVSALGEVFERWDGHGVPSEGAGRGLSRIGQVVAVGSELEVMLRTRDREAALAALRADAGTRFDPQVASVAAEHLDRFAELMDVEPWDMVCSRWSDAPREPVALDGAMRLVADFADAKSAQRLGFSRHVERILAQAAHPSNDLTSLRHAALVHRLGRVAISSRSLDRPGPLLTEDWEQIRLWPHLTEQALARAPGLSAAAALAGMVQERPDGSGYPRGLSGDALGHAARLLSVTSRYVAMTTPRPDRNPVPHDRAAQVLLRESDRGVADRPIVDAVLLAAAGRTPSRRTDPGGLLTPREAEILRLVASGATNRDIAASLSISARTVSTHLERAFTKLGVTTRTAAALAALRRGEISA